MPSATWETLPSGLRIAAAESRALPLVEIRVVILGGSSADGERPGLAALTAELLRTGGAGATSARDELARIESLGGALSARADFDRIILRLAVTKDALGDALGVLADMVMRPGLSPTAFAKVKQHATFAATARSQADTSWMASMVLFQDLFALPVGSHPYASFEATPEDLSKITAMDCRAFWSKYFVPKNTFVVVAGDAVPKEVLALVTKSFTGFAGGEAPAVSFTDPVPPESLKLTLVDRPKAPLASLVVGMLGPSRGEPDFASFMVATRLYDGADAGSLRVVLREAQPPTLVPVQSSVVELAASPVVFSARATAPSGQAGLVLKAMLDRMTSISSEASSDSDVEAARRRAMDILTTRFGSIGAYADVVADIRTLNLWDDAIPAYRKALREVTPLSLGKTASEHIRSAHAVVVAVGDADVIGLPLSHFAEVKVVDPTKGFARTRTIPMNAAAPLAAPRSDAGASAAK